MKKKDKIVINLNDKTYHLKPYTFKDMKYVVSNGIKDIDGLFYNLIGEYDISKYEKIYILLMMKSKIDRNTFEIQYKCNSCNNITESKISLYDSIKYKDTSIEYKDIIIQYADKLEHSLDVQFLDNLNIKEYNIIDNLFKLIEEPVQINSECKCILCGSTNQLSLNINNLIENIIEYDLEDLYKYEVFMKVRGNFLIKEINKLTPIEMEIYKKMIDEII